MSRPTNASRLVPMLIRTLFWLSAAIVTTITMALVAVITIIWPDLPPTSEVQDIRLKEPLRIYSIDGRLMGEFGDERRITVRIEDTPQDLINAILAAEDDRFFSHHGVDPLGVVRALIANLKSRETRQGASTITMQVARNYFLSREKTYTRKLKEALLAFRLERELLKLQILELYVNKIFLGHRSFGFQAAATFYYNKPLNELNLAQLAMLAGLPKAPSSINPVSNPVRALERRNYVLRRMRGLNLIKTQASRPQLRRLSPRLGIVRKSRCTPPMSAKWCANTCFPGTAPPHTNPATASTPRWTAVIKMLAEWP